MGTVSTTLPADGQTVDAADVNVPFNAILGEFNGNIDDNNIKTGANINGAKLLAGSLPGTALDTTLASGWLDLADVPDTVTNNGNRSYDLVFNSNDLTDTVSEGMRLRTTRTVSAPTRNTDLEASSSQYWTKTSPSGISFTTTFTCSAWVKLESYGTCGIIARRNADTEGWSFQLESDGTIRLQGLRIAANNKQISSYQSVPLNKWVHVAATMDMAVADTSAQKIWIDGVEVPRAYVLTGTASALVQGTTALVVGARKSDGSNPFDGKIAQASVHSAQLSDAQIKAMMSQTISSASPSIVSGFTFDNSVVDVNTSNANDLSAVASAVATNVDSPFGNYLGGTLDYAIITKTAFSTNTTLTVQVPEGCTIPTSGGVSAVSYANSGVPYKFPRDSGRWAVESIFRVQTTTTSNANYGAFASSGWALTVPVGAWKVGYDMNFFNSSTLVAVVFSISSTSLVGVAKGSEDIRYTTQTATATSGATSFIPNSLRQSESITSAQTFVMYTQGATTGGGVDADNSRTSIIAEFNYL